MPNGIEVTVFRLKKKLSDETEKISYTLTVDNLKENMEYTGKFSIKKLAEDSIEGLNIKTSAQFLKKRKDLARKIEEKIVEKFPAEKGLQMKTMDIRIGYILIP